MRQVLRLRGNPLGEAAAAPLADAILAGASLAELDVGSCQVHPRLGCKCSAAMLPGAAGWHGRPLHCV